jgi:hypothetical protein
MSFRRHQEANDEGTVEPLLWLANSPLLPLAKERNIPHFSNER